MSEENREFADAYQVKFDGTAADEFMYNLKLFYEDEDKLSPEEKQARKERSNIIMKTILDNVRTHFPPIQKGNTHDHTQHRRAARPRYASTATTSAHGGIDPRRNARC